MVEDAIDGTGVRKRAVEPEARRRLAHEAERLRTLRHPGVVELVGYETGADADVLVTAIAGSLTLADFAPADLGTLAGVLAATAAVLGDLHQAGVSHGALGPDHIIVGRARHPVLCSFGRAGDASPTAVAADLAALADLVDHVASSSRRAGEPSSRRARRQRRQLRAAAVACRRGLSASEMAARLAEVLGAIAPDPGAATDATDDADAADPGPAAVPVVTEAADGTKTWHDRVAPDPAPRRAPRRRPGRTAVVAGSLAALTLGLAALRAWSPGGVDGTQHRPLAAPTTFPSTMPSTMPSPGPPTPSASPTRTPATTRQRCSPAGAGIGGIDVDGDGCPDDVAVEGNLVRIGEAWFAAGDPGDVVAVGDWDCDGSATALVLRPPTGDVFVFDRWAGRDAGLEVESGTRAPGAVAVAVRRQGGCDHAHAVAPDGAVADQPLELS